MTISDIIGRLKESLGAQAERHRNRPFLEATMAACALVAYADETVTFSERSQLDQALERLTQLKIFDPHEGVNVFDETIEALKADPDAGKTAVLARVRRFADDPEAARLLVRVCHAISWADGDVSADERARIDEVCATLGLAFEDCVAV